MSERSRRAQQIGILHLEDIDWYFRVYLMLRDAAEVIEQSVLLRNLSEKVHIVVAECLSEEFKYIRTGFILAHYGRRGVAFSIWHWADWDGTWEYFCQAWYCYGRDISCMVPLDRNEPILCQHEIGIVMKEGLSFKNIAFHSSDHDEIVRLYRACEPMKVSRDEQWYQWLKQAEVF